MMPILHLAIYVGQLEGGFWVCDLMDQGQPLESQRPIIRAGPFRSETEAREHCGPMREWIKRTVHDCGAIVLDNLPIAGVLN